MTLCFGECGIGGNDPDCRVGSVLTHCCDHRHFLAWIWGDQIASWVGTNATKFIAHLMWRGPEMIAT
ncbi:hypothetical protein N9A39_08350, partial [Planktomarina temperata]|nr:hypothetical protein [Planktomarina temperata]